MKKAGSDRRRRVFGFEALSWATLGLLLGALALGPAIVRAGEPAAKVNLNGELVGVFFNDGDSFRILKGRNKGGKARLAGFNTLESHGAVHQWGTWTAKELYHIAKMATLHGRQGHWNCNTDGDTDTYGRMLIFCPDLAESQIRHGFAHAMSVNDDPAEPKYLEAQREAIANKRGIWAHGVPEFVLTSLHSVEEDVEGRGTYNRLVSSVDGHSIKWKHNTKYRECENVCLQVYPSDDSVLAAVATKLKAEQPALVEGISDEDLTTMLGVFQRIRLVDRPVAKDKREELRGVLDGYAEAGMFGSGAPKNGACMVHVPFERRYGGRRAECLK